jgi:hypothetical protein
MPAWASFPWRLHRHLLTKNKSADDKNLLIESADKKKICWPQKSADGICWQKRNLLTGNFFLHNLLKKSNTAGNGKSLKNCLESKWQMRQLTCHCSLLLLPLTLMNFLGDSHAVIYLEKSSSN